MRNSKLALVALATMVTGTMALPEAALAKHYYNDNYNQSYHGRNNYRYRCRSGNGAVGTIAGGAGGALAGSALGGGTLGTVAGGVGGALLGRHLDKQHTRHRNGC